MFRTGTRYFNIQRRECLDRIPLEEVDVPYNRGRALFVGGEIFHDLRFIDDVLIHHELVSVDVQNRLGVQLAIRYFEDHRLIGRRMLCPPH